MTNDHRSGEDVFDLCIHMGVLRNTEGFILIEEDEMEITISSH